MKIQSSFWFVLSLFLAIGFVSCDDDDPVTPEPETITEIAAADAQFSTLVSALTRTGLDQTLNGGGSFTVFAPTNDAFAKLGVDLSTLTDEALTEILLYHVLGAEIKAGEISDGQTYVTTAAETAPGNRALSMLIEKSASGVAINGNVNVTATDIDATNGVIHVVDAVIMPMDVVNHAIANSNFTSLVGALSSASGDLVNVLSGTGPFTVFAPLNSAFDEISSVTATLSNDQLRDVLTYHVAAGNVTASELTNGDVVTVNGAKFTVTLGTDVILTDEQGNESKVILTDVQATNGIIHVIDKVIIPVL
jgi:transforming growth factor-beta-induced protein